MKEIWKDIVGYEELYQVSNLGRVKSLKYDKEKILKQANNKQGYKIVTLHKDKKQTTKTVHRLVAKTFVANPNNYPCINHKDENLENNCIDNLEWCSYAYNNNYGTRSKRAGESNSKKVSQYDLKGNLIKVWDGIINAERKLKIFNTSIVECCKGRRKTAGGFKWKYFEGDL